MLGALAVPAFLLGAALAGPPADVRPTGDAERAPGRAALDPGPTASADVSPASESRAREVAALPAAPTPAPGTPAGLRVQITVRSSGEPVVFGVRWSDGNGRYAGLTEDWGDGTAASSVEVVTCDGEPGPHRGDLTTAHRFPPGRFRVRITVTTADCAGRVETAVAETTIEVPDDDDPATEEAPATPQPTSSPSPTPSATPPGLPLPLPSVEQLLNP